MELELFEYYYDWIMDLVEKDMIATETQRLSFKGDMAYHEIYNKIKSFRISENDVLEHIWVKHNSMESVIPFREGKNPVSWFTCGLSDAVQLINDTHSSPVNTKKLAKWVTNELQKIATKKPKKSKGFSYKGPIEITKLFDTNFGLILLRTDKIAQCNIMREVLSLEIDGKKVKLFLKTAYPTNAAI